MSIEITGLEEMRARLHELAANVREKYVVTAVKDAGHVIAEAMRESAPVQVEKVPGSDALEPGTLRDDIKVRERLDKDGFAVATIGPGKRTGYVARFVEYGHRLVKGKRGQEIGHVAAQPFLRPAFERSAEDAIEKFKETMREEIAGGLK